MLFNLLELYDPEFIDTLVSIQIKQGQIKLFPKVKKWPLMTFDVILRKKKNLRLDFKLAFIQNFEKLRFQT